MIDQTTYLSPVLRLGSDESGYLAIFYAGEQLYVSVNGLAPDAGTAEVFRILTALTYTRRDFSDGSTGYWANFRDGSEFWVSGESLDEVVEQAVQRIAMYLAGRSGYPLFDGILDLDGAK